jgi:hypothetical protein
MKNDWEKKTKCLGLPIKQAKSLPLQRELGRVTLFIWPSMWTRLEHAHCLETINMWILGKEKVSTCGRKRTLTDSERKRNRSAVSSKWNKCRCLFTSQIRLFLQLIDNNLLLPGARLHILNNIYMKMIIGIIINS